MPTLTKLRLPGAGLLLTVWTLSTAYFVSRTGVIGGTVAAVLFATFVWAVVWPMWSLSGRPDVAMAYRRIAFLPMCLFTIVAGVLVWVLDPNGAFPRDDEAWTSWPPLIAEWITLAVIPVSWVRWFRERSNEEREADISTSPRSDDAGQP